MQPTVKLKISNRNDKNYPTINLRKLFNMVFVNPDGKTFNIYTATVFGGAEKVADSEVGVPKPKVTNNACVLDFKYSIEYSDETRADDDDIKVTDLTDAFLSDRNNKYHRNNRNEIRKVWGEIETLDSQNDVTALLKELYPACYPAGTDAVIPAMEKLGTVFHIKDARRDKKSHHCIASAGDYQALTNGYSLTVNKNTVKGIEAINWVKTTIKLKSNILTPQNLEKRNIRFVVEFAGTNKYYTPDFTWYFAPPTNYIVDESATLTIGNNKAVHNKIAPVADGTTVRFEEWLDEGIGERKKSRVLDLSDDPYGFTNSTVEVLISFTNPSKHGNLQFFMGMIASYLLGFCSDMTRITEYYEAAHVLCGDNCWLSKVLEKCICENLSHLLSVVFPFVTVSAFCAIIYREKDCIPQENRTRLDKWAIRSRWLGLICSGLLMIYINIGWLVTPRLVSQLVKTCLLNKIVVATCLLLALCGNILYICYCWIGKKRNLIDFF